MPLEISHTVVRRKRRIDWRLIRSVGELHLLTRASVFFLIFVPVLAGLWPIVYGIVTKYSQATGQCIDPPNMPGSWALMFFASLFTLAGQLVYQWYAHEIVRELAGDDFVRHQLDLYDSVGSAALQDRAAEFLRITEAYEEPPYQLRAKRPIVPREIVEKSRGHEKPSEIEKERKEAREYIRKGAEAEYQVLSSLSVGAIRTAAVLYGLALSLIVLVLLTQTWSVAEAAGWLP